MISPEDVHFSPTTIDNNLPSPLPRLTNSVASPDFLDDILMECNMLDPDTADQPPFDENEIDRSLDENMEGSDQAQPTIFDGDLSTLLEQLKLLSEDHSISNVNGIKDTIQNNSIVIQTSDLNAHSNVINSTCLYQTGIECKDVQVVFRPKQKRRTKRLQRKLNTIQQRNASKNLKQIKRTKPEGAHPHGNR